VDFQTRNW